ncbi:MAG TPA: TrbI/VirB10 family protein [Candidatus Omnitrophota bacterium]|nr:TrbI/VirB10 family protein [Candidatus Omnitrophota bacterium]
MKPEIFKKKPEKKTSELPTPPEPEFFDEPKRANKAAGFVQNLLEKKSLRIALVIAGVFMLSILLFSKPAHKRAQNPMPRPEENRIMITTQSMERAIDSSAKGKTFRAKQSETRQNLSGKRKYTSEIAVFIDKPENPKPQTSSKVRSEDAKLGIPSGTKIPALLNERIFSFNVAAPVTALVSKDFSVKNQVVIPQGSRFLGEVNVVKSVDRVNVRFDLLIFPDGRELRIRAIALSEDGSGGIKGKVDKHTDTKVLKAIGETLLAGASLFVGGRSQDAYSLEDQMRVNLADNLTNQASQDLRSVKVDKSITVESGINIEVMLLEAI